MPQNPTYNPHEHRYGGSAALLDYLILSQDKVNPAILEAGSPISLFVKYRFPKAVDLPIYGLTLKSHDGFEVFGSNSMIESLERQAKKQGDWAILRFDLPLNLVSGDYFISLGLAAFEMGEALALDRRYDLIHLRLNNPTQRYGVADLNMKITQIH